MEGYKTQDQKHGLSQKDSPESRAKTFSRSIHESLSTLLCAL